MSAERHSVSIKKWAEELGFEQVGISRAGYLASEAPRLDDWLAKGMHGRMSYMENWRELRLDPRQLVPGAKSVVSFLYNYYPSKQQREDAPGISKYAYGEDYHFVIKRKLKELLRRIREEIGEVAGRAFVDSGPVLERVWAARGGLGWIGKHSLLLNQHKGSFFFLAELVLDLDLLPDHPVTDRCGTCTRCMDACPTDAIPLPYVVDGSKCISYLTIELREEIPSEFAGKMENWMFGCDICQDVCPWNRFSTPHREQAFEPSEALLSMSANEWEEITEDVFGEIFKKSAVKRTRYTGLMRNLAFLRRPPGPDR